MCNISISNKHKKKNREEQINCQVILEWLTKSGQTPGELAKSWLWELMHKFFWHIQEDLSAQNMARRWIAGLLGGYQDVTYEVFSGPSDVYFDRQVSWKLNIWPLVDMIHPKFTVTGTNDWQCLCWKKGVLHARPSEYESIRATLDYGQGPSPWTCEGSWNSFKSRMMEYNSKMDIVWSWGFEWRFKTYTNALNRMLFQYHLFIWAH